MTEASVIGRIDEEKNIDNHTILKYANLFRENLLKL